MSLSSAELAELDGCIDRGLDRGEQSLELLGYGEISSVVAYRGHACKRLPLFTDRGRVAAYRRAFDCYLAALDRAGIRALPSTVHEVERPDQRVAVYCVQPAVPVEDVGSTALLAEERVAARYLEEIFAAVFGAIGPELGIDGQISNWALWQGELCYLDVTTPFVRDSRGRHLLDVGLWLDSLPWIVRGMLRETAGRAVIRRYHTPRMVVVDLLANLRKEGASAYLPLGLRLANQRAQPAITADEIRRYYRADACMWAGMQFLRRAERAWRERVRGDRYTFPLPGKIERWGTGSQSDGDVRAP